VIATFVEIAEAVPAKEILIFRRSKSASVGAEQQMVTVTISFLETSQNEDTYRGLKQNLRMYRSVA
jgi:hypothetical protein